MWEKLTLNKNSIKAETEKSFLIKLPKSEFLFWHPSKLCRRSGKGGYDLSVSYTDTFTFKLFRNGKGQYNNHTKIEEIKLTAKELKNRFFNIEEKVSL